MIEKMKSVCVISALSGKQAMLEGLKNLGILHISEKKAPVRETSEYCLSLIKTLDALRDYMPKKKEKALSDKQVPVLQGEAFQTFFEQVKETLERKNSLLRQNAANRAEIERIAPWGEISPDDISFLRANDFDLHFYRLSKKDFKAVTEDETIQAIRLAPVEKQVTFATLGPLPLSIQAMAFALPERSMAELEREIEENDLAIEACDKFLRDAAHYQESFTDEILRAQNAVEFSSANETTEKNDVLVWLSGYIPEEEIERFKEGASARSWAYVIDDVAEDDDQVPTRIKYNKVSKLIKPVFDILGILPGYRETDIALWFLLFFTLFFAMIIGDAGYGVLILIGTVVIAVRTKTKNTAIYLLFVLSIATILWGSITGTWFGLESAMNVPILKALVIPSFASYPEYFGVSTLEAQNAFMKFSFTIGAIQMSLGSLIAIKKKLGEKNLSWVADLGWMIAVIAMYLLSLYLVIGENIPILPVFIGIGTAFLLVVLFGGMSPDKTFGQGLKAGLTDTFTTFLNTISCFGNVMSYIRLFAVGMAGLAISQSFNNIASGFSGPLMIAGIVVVLIGHGLNIIMCFLSVVVHGVRLNVLEFSGQVGLEWTGIAYEPFEEKQKKNKQSDKGEVL